MVPYDGAPDAEEGALLNEPDQDQTMSTEDMSKKKTNSVEESLRWLSQKKPLAQTEQVVWRLALVPLQAMARQQFLFSGDKWERKQSAKAAEHESSSHSLGRDFQVLHAARGTMERAALMRVIYLLETEAIWILIHPDDKTNDTRGTAFKVLSGAGSLIEKHFVSRHSMQPFTSFLVVDRPQYKDTLDAQKPCLHSVWSKKFAETFGYGERARRRLLLLLHLMTPYNIKVEAGNASLRRFVKRRVQTHQVDLAEMNALWLAQQTRLDTTSPPDGESKSEDADADAQAEEAQHIGIFRRCVENVRSPQRGGR